MSTIAQLRLGCIAYDEGRAPVRFAGHTFRFEALVAVVRCTDGAYGLGLAWARLKDELAYVRAGLPVLSEALRGRDASLPYESGRLAQDRAARLGIARLASVVELALWDLAGHLCGAPVCDMLGRKRRALPAYAISAEEFSFTAVEQYPPLVARFRDRGFRACKLHLFGDADRDIAACRAVRRAVGDDIILMLDPAGRYRAEDALRVARAIADLGFVRLEDPLSPDDRAGYRWLAPRIDVPIAVNDSLRWTPGECLDAVRAGTVQCLRFDPGRAGISQALGMAAVAEAAGAEFDLSAFAPRGGVEASLHLALAATSARWFEHHEAAGLDEVPGVSGGIRIASGTAEPSGSPGFGAEVDWRELDRRCAWAA